jgi:hypothetical protein
MSIIIKYPTGFPKYNPLINFAIPNSMMLTKKQNTILR